MVVVVVVVVVVMVVVMMMIVVMMVVVVVMMVMLMMMIIVLRQLHGTLVLRGVVTSRLLDPDDVMRRLESRLGQCMQDSVSESSASTRSRRSVRG